MRVRPRVLIVGGEDVDRRIDLMHGLAADYELAAAGTRSDLAASFAQAGFPYYYYPLHRGVGPLGDLIASVKLWHVISRFQPDIVHAFDTKPGVYGCLAARLAGVPVVLGTITGLGSLYGENGLASQLVRGVYEGLQRRASHYTDATIFQNRDDREELVARRVVPACKATLIAGSGVNTDVLEPARVGERERRELRSVLGIPADALVVTMISRVIRKKGVETFVAAARDVQTRFPKARFLLVGPVDQESVDRFSPEELAGFAQSVNWPGARKDVLGVLAASDLFVLPSYLREGIPRVLLEAAAMGLPLIATDTPGCNDVVEHGVNGCLVPVNDTPALIQAIEQLLQRPDLRRTFGRTSRERAVDRFDLSVVVERTRSLYQELIVRKTPLARSTSLRPIVAAD
jgi:glycosyltransferase involved in cell wall biosynthesis